jgi:hypothetical protein
MPLASADQQTGDGTGGDSSFCEHVGFHNVTVRLSQAVYSNFSIG